MTLTTRSLPLLILLIGASSTLFSSQPISQPVPRAAISHPPKPAVAAVPNDKLPGAVPAVAGGLENSVWQYYAYCCPYGGPGVIGGIFDGYFAVLADAHSITFDYSVLTTTGPWSPSVLSLPPTIHNGIAVTVPTTVTIHSVTIDPATNMPGFDASRVSFKAGRIEVDWQNLPFNASTIVKLDVE